MVEAEFVAEDSGCADTCSSIQSGCTSEVSIVEHHLTCGDICKGKCILTREIFSDDSCNSFQDHFSAVNMINAFTKGVITKLAHVRINASSW